MRHDRSHRVCFGRYVERFVNGTRTRMSLGYFNSDDALVDAPFSRVQAIVDGYTFISRDTDGVIEIKQQFTHGAVCEQQQPPVRWQSEVRYWCDPASVMPLYAMKVDELTCRHVFYVKSNAVCAVGFAEHLRL